jgi:hypothetical protein
MDRQGVWLGDLQVEWVVGFRFRAVPEERARRHHGLVPAIQNRVIDLPCIVARDHMWSLPATVVLPLKLEAAVALECVRKVGV